MLFRTNFQLAPYSDYQLPLALSRTWFSFLLVQTKKLSQSFSTGVQESVHTDLRLDAYNYTHIYGI